MSKVTMQQCSYVSKLLPLCYLHKTSAPDHPHLSPDNAILSGVLSMHTTLYAMSS